MKYQPFDEIQKYICSSFKKKIVLKVNKSQKHTHGGEDNWVGQLEVCI